MKKKRTKQFNLGALLWSLCILNVIAGMWTSKATRVRHVTVTSPKRFWNSISNIVSNYQSVPWLQLSKPEIEAKIELISGVEQAHLVGNIFGSSRIVATSKKSSGSLVGQIDDLDDRGNFFTASPGNRSSLISPPAQALTPFAGLCRPIDLVDLVGTLKKLGPAWESPSNSLELSDGGDLCLNRDNVASVLFGSPVDMDQKVAELNHLKVASPAVFDEKGQIVLIAPDRPTFSPQTVHKSAKNQSIQPIH